MSSERSKQERQHIVYNESEVLSALQDQSDDEDIILSDDEDISVSESEYEESIETSSDSISEGG